MIHIIVDGRWLLQLIGSLLGWAGLILLGVYLLAGPWWTLATASTLLALTLLTIKIIRRVGRSRTLP